jgi:hypothetical protein
LLNRLFSAYQEFLPDQKVFDGLIFALRAGQHLKLGAEALSALGCSQVDSACAMAFPSQPQLQLTRRHQNFEE